MLPKQTSLQPCIFNDCPRMDSNQATVKHSKSMTGLYTSWLHCLLLAFFQATCRDMQQYVICMMQYVAHPNSGHFVGFVGIVRPSLLFLML